MDLFDPLGTVRGSRNAGTWVLVDGSSGDRRGPYRWVSVLEADEVSMRVMLSWNLPIIGVVPQTPASEFRLAHPDAS